jgi:hypothetical protein
VGSDLAYYGPSGGQEGVSGSGFLPKAWHLLPCQGDEVPPMAHIQCRNPSCRAQQVTVKLIRIKPGSRLTLPQLERAHLFNEIIIGLFYLTIAIVTITDTLIVISLFANIDSLEYLMNFVILMLTILLVYLLWTYVRYSDRQLEVRFYECKRCGYKWSPNYDIEPPDP